MIRLAQEKIGDRGPRTENRRPLSEVSDLIGRSSVVGHQSSVMGRPALSVALLTGGSDKPYALGIAAALTSVGMSVDFIGSDELSVPELLNNSEVKFLNLRGDQSSDAAP